MGDEGDMVGLRDENGVGVAVQTGEDIGSQVVDGADEVFVAHEDVCEAEADENCADPGAHEACHHMLVLGQESGFGDVGGVYLRQSSSG